jgi:hypothetical protein
MKPRLFSVCALCIASSLAQASSSVDTDYLTPRIAVGEHNSNIYSIASSVKAEGFDELVRRNSGSADYTLTQESADHALTFNVRDIYDGSPVNQGEFTMREGGATDCNSKGECHTYTDASGLLYNQLLWGRPPEHLTAGMTWKVTINQAWEFGAAGTQTVTVMRVDDANGTVTLMREGAATGALADEPTEVTLVKNGKKITLDVTPGKAQWTGYTTFRHGIVLNDELLVTRTEDLDSKETGIVKATLRRYMLSNAAPYPTL